MFYQHPRFKFVYKRSWPIRKEWLRRKGFFKRLARYGAGGLFIAALAVINILLLRGASATFQYTASDVLGQMNSSFSSVKYDSYGANGVPPANQIGFDGNSGMALDSVNHRLFVADTANSRVAVYQLDTSNHFTKKTMDYAIGQPGFATEDQDHTTSCVYFGQFGNPMPSNGLLCEPDSVVYDSVHNRLFVGDMGWDRVLVYDLSSGISNTMLASYVLGQADFTSGTDSTTCLNSPNQNQLCFGFNGGNGSGLAYDSTNQQLFVGESARNRTMVFDVNPGTIANGENAVHVLGQANFTTKTSNTTQNGESDPGGLFYDPTTKQLFESDRGNCRVLIYDLSGGITDGMNAGHVLGQADFTSSTFNSPPTQSSISDSYALYYDSASSKLFVADNGGYRTLIYNLSGGITDGMNASNVLGQANFTAFVTNATTQSSQLSPEGVLYDPANQQLLVDDSGNARLLTYDMSGAISNGMNASHVEGQADYLGNPSYTFGASDNANPGPYGYSNGVNGIAEDTVHHRLYVGDYDNNRVLVYNLDANNHLIDHQADYVLGANNFTTNSSSSFGAGCANSTTTCQPIALAADSSGNRLFVSNYFDSRVEIFDFSGGISNGMAASHVIGQPNLTTVGEHCSPTTGQNNLCDAAGLAYDSNHKILYVSEEGNSRIMSFNADPSTMTDGENALHVLGQPNFTSSNCDGGGVTARDLCSPEGIAYDNTNNWLFVTEDDNNRELLFDLSGPVTDYMNASHVFGQPNFTTNSCNHGGRGAWSLCNPFGAAAYDAASQRLFIPDTGNARVLSYNLAGGITDGMNASSVYGTTDSQTFGAGNGCNVTTQSSICDPQDLIYDQTAGKLYVPTVTDNRILVFNVGVHITTTSLPDGITSVPYSQSIATIDSSGSNSFSISSGSLPPGLGINSSTGVISGTPTAVGVYSFSVQVSDSLGETDTANLSISIGNAYKASDVLGQLDSGGNPDFNSGNTNATTISDASGVLIDHAHQRMFVASQFLNRVSVFSLDAQDHPTSKYASFELGQPGFNTSTAGAGSTGMNIAFSIAYDSANQRLFVDDQGNSRILEFDLAGGISNGMAAAHVIGQPDFNSTSCTGSASTTNLCNPQGVYYDSAGQRLFVADTNYNRVLEYDISGGVSDGMAASHVFGQSLFTTSAYATSSTGLGNPAGLTYDSTNKLLYVGEIGNHRATVFNISGGITDGMAAAHVLGQPDFTTSNSCANSPATIAAGDMCQPIGLFYDSSTHYLFESDGFYDRVAIFDMSGGVSDNMAAVHELGQTDLTTYNWQGAGANKSLSAPINIYYDSNNQNIYVPTQGTWRVYDFDLSGGITDGMAASSYLGGTDANTIKRPAGTLIDSVNHRMFVADPFNSRVLIYNLDANNNLIDHTADFVLGQPDFTSGGLDNTNCSSYGGTPSASNMCYPSGLTFDSANNRLFVADQNDNRILAFDLSGGISNGMAAAHVLGQPGFGTDASNLTADGLSSPYGGVQYDPTSHYLYVGDGGNGRVLVYDLSGGISNGIAASFVLGQPDFVTYNYPALTQDGIEGPDGLAIDTVHHRLFVADWYDAGRVMVFDTSALANGMNATNVLGEADFVSNNSASDNGNTPDAKSFGPEDVTYDSKHNLLFVGDGNDNRVLIFDVSTITNNQSAIGLLGQPTFTFNDTSCVASRTSICSPGGLDDYYDTNLNRLYISDSFNSNGRVMIYDFNKLVTPASSGTVGSAYSFNTNSQTQGTTSYSLTSGTLPNGLGLDSSTGVISGTPTAGGLFNFAVHSTDNNGPAGTFADDANYSVNIASGGGDSTPPSVPTGLQVTGHTVSSISLSWNAASDNVGVTGYHIFRDGVQVGTPAGTTFTDTGLASSTTYNYTVSAFDAAANESAPSSPAVPGTTDAPPDNTPPSTPTGLQVTSTTTTTIILSWNPSTDNVGIANYNIYRDGGSTPIAVVGGTGFTDTGLNPSTTYSYTVSAVDTSSNESPQSTPVQGTTTATGNNGGGGNNGSSNQTGSSAGGGKPGSSSNKTVTPPASVPINLDNLPAATQHDVCSGVNSASAGQVFSFTSTDGAQHKVTVLQVGADSIVVKIDNLPKTLFVGQLISQDVTGDGTADICLDVLSITNGVAKLDIARIVFAIAPGVGTTHNGFGAGSGNNSNGNTVVKASPSFLTNALHHIPKALLLAFPWLLFILLGSSVARLMFLSIQERRYAGRINEQLAREKALSEQKNNFVALSSHYLRTPITTISTGIELASGLSPDLSSKQSLKNLSELLSSRVNDLLNQAEHKAPSEIQAPAVGSVVQSNHAGVGLPVTSTAGGYIQLNSLQSIMFAMLAAFGLVGLADYILTRVDLYNVGLIHILTQLAGLGLMAVILVASLRSYHNKRDLRQQSEKLLANQRELETAKNTLIKSSLDSLKGPLSELKGKLAAVSASPGANPAALKPALDGIAQLEGLLSKFVIAASLENGYIGKNARSVDINQLVGSAVQRYTSAVQSKYLAVKNQVSPAVISQDQLLLSFVIDSLLNNAIKYSPSNSEIIITGKRKAGSVEFSVHDNGPGVPDQKQAELFQPFSRAENAVQDFSTQGAGLSLYLDKLVLEYLGGDIKLQSSPSGTTVTFSVPG